MLNATTECAIEDCNSCSKTCTVAGCNTQLSWIGGPGRSIAGTETLCQIHYTRLKATGDVFKVKCACRCEELVDLYGDNETLITYAPGHANKLTATERKVIRAQAVMERIETTPGLQLARTEAADLNWLLAQQEQRRCGKCQTVKPIDQFSKRKTDGRRGINNSHFGWVSHCNPCQLQITQEWHKKNVIKRYARTCAQCGAEYMHSRKTSKCLLRQMRHRACRSGRSRATCSSSG